MLLLRSNQLVKCRAAARPKMVVRPIYLFCNNSYCTSRTFATGADSAWLRISNICPYASAAAFSGKSQAYFSLSI